MAKEASIILSHWHKLFEGFQESSQRMYSLMEEEINKRNIPDIKLSRVTHSEKGVLSAKREYLRARRKERIFDICAAPFGTGFFISWWLGIKGGFSIKNILIIIFLPVIGLIWVLRSQRETFYSLDTTTMFQDSVHSAVLDAIGQATEGKGVRALSELEKKPIMRDLFKRKIS